MLARQSDFMHFLSREGAIVKLFSRFHFGCILSNAKKKKKEKCSKSLLIAMSSARKCSLPSILFSLPCVRQKPSLYQTVAEKAVIQALYNEILFITESIGKQPVQLSYLHCINFYNPKLPSERRFLYDCIWHISNKVPLTTMSDWLKKAREDFARG